MRLLKLSAVVVAGVLLALLFTAPQMVSVFAAKLAGASACPWRSLASLPHDLKELGTLRQAASERIRLAGEEPETALQLFRTPTRQFWIKRTGEGMNGHQLLAFVLAEQEWIGKLHPDHGVRPGDVVVDVGAHVGTFGDDALRRGAARVIMLEPDPVNGECIRRNFRREIAEGKVVLVPEGAWSSVDTLDFHVSGNNSGMGSVVQASIPTGTVKVPVRPLDDILRSIGVDRVDFVKMDIEGAEREALRGMANLLRKWKPRLMLDSYHLEDDDVVLPATVASLNPAYSPHRKVCCLWGSTGKSLPYVVFYD